MVAATVSAPVEKAKKARGVAYTHVVMAYLDKGVDAVQELFAKGNLTKDTIRTALRNLKGRGREATDLQSWYDEACGSTVGAPAAGDTRVYTAQVQKGSPTAFIKLPLPGVKRGAAMEALFEAGGVVHVAPTLRAASVSDEASEDAEA